jgi:hypothetical protein
MTIKEAEQIAAADADVTEMAKSHVRGVLTRHILSLVPRPFVGLLI